MINKQTILSLTNSKVKEKITAQTAPLSIDQHWGGQTGAGEMG